MMATIIYIHSGYGAYCGEIWCGATAGIEDVKLDLAAYYQSLEDAGLDLETLATKYNDVITPLTAYGQDIDDFRSWLRAVLNSLHDFGVMLAATDGIVLKDMAAFLAATDGIVLKDMGLFMQVISASPVFRTRISQRMASIVHEVA